MKGKSAIFTSQLIKINHHRLDLIFNNCKMEIPVIDNAKGSDIVQIVKSKEIDKFIICRHSAKNNNFYDILYCEPSDPEIISQIDPGFTNFLNLPLINIFQRCQFVVTRYQRSALFIFTIDAFKERFAIRNFAINQQTAEFRPSSLFKMPEKHIFQIKLPTGMTIKIKISLLETVTSLVNKSYSKMVTLYPNSLIRPVQFYRLFSKLGSVDPKRTLKDDPVILESLKQQKKNSSKIYFFLMALKVVTFDKSIADFIRELELANIQRNEETNIFNSEMSLLRQEIEKERYQLKQSNPLWSKIVLSTTDPSLPEKKIEERFVIMKTCINMNTKKPADEISTSSVAVAVRVNYDTTANEAICMFIEKLNTLQKAQQQTETKSRLPFEMPGHELEKCQSGNRNLIETPSFLSKSDEQGPDLVDSRTVRSNEALSQSCRNLSGKFPFSSTPNFPSSTNWQSNHNDQQSDNMNPNLKTRNMMATPPIPEARGPYVRRQTLQNMKAARAQSQIFSENKITLEQITQYHPEKFVLIISGTDEVLTGNTPISHFVAVRHFILSEQPILSVSLHNKDDIISLIHSSEDATLPIEIKPDISPKPLIVDKSPDNFRLNDFGFIPQSEVKSNIHIHIQKIYNLKGNKDDFYFLRVCLMYGMKLLCPPTLSKLYQGRNALLVDEQLEILLPLYKIPREARISITLYKYESNQRYRKHDFLTEEQLSQQGIQAAATINLSLYKFSGWIDSDYQTRRMWRNKDIDYFLTTCESNSNDPIIIDYSLSRFNLPICFVPYTAPDTIESISTISANDLSRIKQLRQNDPLTPLTVEDRQLLWRYRKNCSTIPELLPLLLDSIEYDDPEQVREIPLLLNIWEKPPPMLALSLLDAKYANRMVRDYAVSCLEPFTDNEVFLFLLQLVQALKYELYEDSSLARFLLRKGLIETRLIGHQLFWQLMSEAHLSHIRNRFSLMIVNFMYGVGSVREELIKGYRFTQDLVKLNKELSNLSYQKVQEPFREALKKIEIPKQFHLPVDCRLTVENFVIDKCKVMNSKKKPFFLVFKNAAPFATEPVMTMFKVGDDLRQDQLILQIMKVMDHLWKSEHLDFRMRLYGVLSTGLNQGFIEVVPNAVTESDLQVDKGTFNKQIFIQFLRENNPTDNGFEAARRNFLMSSCGYAVSTCVLGVADRHPGNIMIQKDGHFFHIDYGHFLGNFKTKYGIQCEDAPFHFINAHVALLDGLNSIYFKTFLDESGKAMNVLRKNARLLITILMLMLGTGIPELTKAEDIQYFKKMLFLKLNDKEAIGKFKDLTMQSLSSWKTLLKAKVHNVKVG